MSAERELQGRNLIDDMIFSGVVSILLYINTLLYVQYLVWEDTYNNVQVLSEGHKPHATLITKNA